jgi:hypothetical protein
MDESTDVSDTAQLDVFVRGIDMKFNITEQLAAVVPGKGIATGADLYEGKVWIS